MEDRNVFLDAFYAYYTDLEPEHAWVACADAAVVGFSDRLHRLAFKGMEVLTLHPAWIDRQYPAWQVPVWKAFYWICNRYAGWCAAR